MALQEINIGASPNDGSGDPLRTAMTKVNENFGAAGSGVYDVTHPDYGAVGNGVANDTTAINAASAAAAGGGIVRFPFTQPVERSCGWRVRWPVERRVLSGRAGLLALVA